MKFGSLNHLVNQESLKGALLASLFGSLPTIMMGVDYLIINITHGIDFATGGQMGENRISAMISILNINTLWLPLTGFFLLVPVVRNNKAAAVTIALLQILGAAINFSRGLETVAFLELIVAATAVLGNSNHISPCYGLEDTDE